MALAAYHIYSCSECIKKGLNIFCTFLSLTIFVCCNQNTEPKNTNGISPVDSVLAPVLITAGSPKIFNINALPAARSITVPLHAGGAYVSEKNEKIPLLPPGTKPAGFYITMHNFDTENGLALSSILCGLKDKLGNLWFGTSGNGASKYNGQSFTNYNSSHGLIHNLINCMMQDSKGNIWFGTYGGLSKFDGKSFSNFTIENGLPNNDVVSLLEDKNGNIWIGTAEGLSKYNGKSFVNYNKTSGLPSSNIRNLQNGTNGNLLVATAAGICIFDAEFENKRGKAFINYFKTNSPVFENIRMMHQAKNGNLWLGTNEGLLLFDGASFTRFNTGDGLAGNEVNCIAEDKTSNIWFGTKAGVSQYLPATEKYKKGSFLNFTTNQGLSNNNVYCITADNGGSLWFGTYGGGLSRYDGSGLVSFGTQEGLSNDLVYCITQDKDGNLWFGTGGGGIDKYDGNSFSNFSTQQGLHDNTLNSMLTDSKGNLWIGSYEGLSKFDGKTFTYYTIAQGLVNNAVVSMMEDREGNLWLGTYEGGLSKFDGKTFSNYTTAQGLVHNTVWSMLEDEQGKIWLATRGGLSIFDGKSFLNFTKAQGLAENKLSKIFEDSRGNFLIGTWGSGISILRKENALFQNNNANRKNLFETFSTSEGLANDVVYNMVEDSVGDIAIGTSAGFSILKGGLGQPGQIAKEGIEIYNQKTGYPIKDVFNNNGMFIDNNNVIWAGMGDKLIKFDYKKIIKTTKPPAVVIQNIRINNEAISWQSLQEKEGTNTAGQKGTIKIPPYIFDELMVFGKKLNSVQQNSLYKKFGGIHFDSVSPISLLPQKLVLPYKHNNISFNFTGIETARPGMVRYQYMLDDYDKGWSPVSDKANASFGNIPQGHYTFKVKAQGSDGIWSEPVTYKFEVLPPWWLSWWMYFVYILLLAGALLLVHRFMRNRVLFNERQQRIKLELEHAREIEKAYNDLKEAQIQLVHSEKLASLGELIAGIAHEIQNPLNFVKNFAEVNMELATELIEEAENGNIKEINELAVDIRNNEEKIINHGNRASAIVRGMLQHARTSSGQKEAIDINALADEYLRLSFHGLRAKDKTFNATFETDFDPAIKNITVMPQEFGRVLLNLINNAFYAVIEKSNSPQPLKGSEEIYQPMVAVSTRLIIPPSGGPRGAEIRIIDNGTGIPQQLLDKIFQPFFTTKPSGEGTGLGLSLSYDIITKGHGGSLRVETKEGEGAAFIINLPISNE